MKAQEIVKLRNGFKVLMYGTAGSALYLTLNGNEYIYRNFIFPTIICFDAEKAHRSAIFFLKHFHYFLRSFESDSRKINTEFFSHNLSSPIGLAAGFDKHCEVVHGAFSMGFGFTEVGTVTPLPQNGNPKPRVFRLLQDLAVINSYGFNSVGHDVAKHRLVKIKHYEMAKPLSVDDHRNMLNVNFNAISPLNTSTISNPSFHRFVGVNIGKNKTSENEIEDYVKGVETFGSFADYIAINVSSPNTPGLRDLQSAKSLVQLLTAVSQARDKLSCKKKPLIFVKLSPDLSDQELSEIATCLLLNRKLVDAVILTNTTISRPKTLQSDNRDRSGGLSGEPLRELATSTIRRFYSLTNGTVPIIGVGGVASGADAYEKVRAGASLVQLYSALVYHGPQLVHRINRELEELLERDGFASVSDAVGADFKENKLD